MLAYSRRLLAASAAPLCLAGALFAGSAAPVDASELGLGLRGELRLAILVGPLRRHRQTTGVPCPPLSVVADPCQIILAQRHEPHTYHADYAANPYAANPYNAAPYDADPYSSAPLN
jgi:hypothetical protein